MITNVKLKITPSHKMSALRANLLRQTKHACLQWFGKGQIACAEAFPKHVFSVPVTFGYPCHLQEIHHIDWILILNISSNYHRLLYHNLSRFCNILKTVS